MSGGSLDYVYTRVLEAAGAIRHRCDSATHLAFADHLELVAIALKDVEWVLSCDKAKGDDIPSILKVIDKAEVLAGAVDRAESAMKELQAALTVAKG